MSIIFFVFYPKDFFSSIAKLNSTLHKFIVEFTLSNRPVDFNRANGYGILVGSGADTGGYHYG